MWGYKPLPWKDLVKKKSSHKYSSLPGENSRHFDVASEGKNGRERRKVTYMRGKLRTAERFSLGGSSGEGKASCRGEEKGGLPIRSVWKNVYAGALPLYDYYEEGGGYGQGAEKGMSTEKAGGLFQTEKTPPFSCPRRKKCCDPGLGKRKKGSFAPS